VSTAAPPEILLVSKPLAPPWNDSGKNLPRCVAAHGERFSYRVLLPKGADVPGPRCVPEPIYGAGGAGGFSPSFASKARVLMRLLGSRGEALRHFFFAPNPATSKAARFAQKRRPLPTVQTVSSRPRDPARLGQLLFADRVVALSRATEAALVEAGVARERVVRIPPGVPLPKAPASADDRARGRKVHGLPAEGSIVLFPGDLEFSSAADTFAGAAQRLAMRSEADAVTFVLACRQKTQAAAAAGAALAERLAPLGARAIFVGEVKDMSALLAAADVVALPADDLYAKMDLPLVLIEAMALGRPVVVADVAPIHEVIERGGGVAVPGRDPEALAATLLDLATNTSRCHSLGEAAVKAVGTELSDVTCARRHEDLYAELLGAAARSQAA
jgi:phosphatidylinositol alpha-1,6-mannosyltransferase